MNDDCVLSLLYAVWLAASTMPIGLMLGATCSPCCGCRVADGKPRTDPKDEGTWVPSGTWGGGISGVTWSFTANPGNESGETWFFYGSSSTSRVGGGASTAAQQDWGNICNWYSNKTTTPDLNDAPQSLSKRATRLPPRTAVVHIYTPVSTVNFVPQTIKNIYFWDTSELLAGSQITTTAAAHDSVGGAVFSDFFVTGSSPRNYGTVNGGATFCARSRNYGTVNGGATLHDTSVNFGGTVTGGATFNDSSLNGSVGDFTGPPSGGTVTGGATFNDVSRNSATATVGGHATFNDDCFNAGVTGDATFNDSSGNGFGGNGTVDGDATFNDDSSNSRPVTGNATFNGTSGNFFSGTVDGDATFNVSSVNFSGTVNGDATFNDSSQNQGNGTVNGTATFNDAACSTRTVGSFSATPCTRKFVAHPTNLPTCNGTAPNGCFAPAATCGCG